MIYELHIVARSRQEAALVIADHIQCIGGDIVNTAAAPMGGLVVRFSTDQDIRQQLNDWYRADMAQSTRHFPGKLLGYGIALEGGSGR